MMLSPLSFFQICWTIKAKAAALFRGISVSVSVTSKTAVARETAGKLAKGSQETVQPESRQKGLRPLRTAPDGPDEGRSETVLTAQTKATQKRS